MVNLKFAKHGSVFAPIDIKPLREMTMRRIMFKVDTGADNTTISKPDLVVLGYCMEWIQQNVVAFPDDDKPTTASGDRVKAGYVQLPAINMFGYEGKQWPFFIIVDEDKDFRNLLGRDLLTGFNYHFNNDDDVFSIDRTKTFKSRYGFLPGQEIQEMVSGQ